MAQISALYADHHPDEVQVLESTLHASGTKLTHVADDKRVLLEMHRHDVDVVVVDVDLPTMGGYRMLERWPDVPVILVSDRPNVSEAVNAVKAGAADFASKPQMLQS